MIVGGLNKRMEEQKQIQERNPMFTFGYGIVAHFTLIEILIGVFAFLALCSIPITVFYSQFSAHDRAMNKGGMTSTTLGNLGISASKCSSVPLDIGTF